MAKILIFVFLLFTLVVCSALETCAQTTEFTYQGSLKDGANPAAGNYDFEFLLFDSLGGPTQIGPTLTRSSVAVANGIFSVKIDFGSQFPGADRYLEVRVRQTGGGGFTPLTPRQLVNSAPYSVKSLNAASTDALSAACIGCVTAAKIASGQVVKGVTVGATTLTDNVTLAAGSNITITPAGNTLTIASTGVDGSGTTNSIPLWSAGTTLGNSLIRESGGEVNIGTGVLSGGLLNVSGSSGSTGVHSEGFIGVNGQSISPNGIGVEGGASGSGSIGVYGSSGNGISVQGLGVGTGSIGVDGVADAIGVRARGNSQHSIALRTIGSSWFQGDTSPLDPANTGTGTGIVVGSIDTSTGHFGYVQAFDYSVAQTRILALNSSGGSVGIGTTTPNQTLEVNGRARVTSIPLIGQTSLQVCFNGAGDLIQCGASSLKWKTNVRAYHSGLDVIRRLRPISFNWKEDGRADIGLGAEDVAKVAPSFALTDNKGEVEGVRYERLSILLINAVKEQQGQIESQQKIVENQQKMIETQQQEIEALKQLVCTKDRKAALCVKSRM